MDLTGQDAISINVGMKLREIREERGLSIRALGRASGVSANAISMIERGRTSPSVSTLYKIADALGISITGFFPSERETDNVVLRRALERTRVPFQRGIWEGLGGERFSGPVESFALTLESGANSGPYPITHSGHEFVYCLRGQLEYQVEGKIYVLEAGDSLLFSSQLQHRWRNPGSLVTNAIIVLCGFEEGERPLQRHIFSQKPEVDVAPVSDESCK
jgi:transcriptional regulator with XRE-family HTH domain